MTGSDRENTVAVAATRPVAAAGGAHRFGVAGSDRENMVAVDAHRFGVAGSDRENAVAACGVAAQSA